MTLNRIIIYMLEIVNNDFLIYIYRSLFALYGTFLLLYHHKDFRRQIL